MRASLWCCKPAILVGDGLSSPVRGSGSWRRLVGERNVPVEEISVCCFNILGFRAGMACLADGRAGIGGELAGEQPLPMPSLALRSVPLAESFFISDCRRPLANSPRAGTALSLGFRAAGFPPAGARSARARCCTSSRESKPLLVGDAPVFLTGPPPPLAEPFFFAALDSNLCINS